MNLIVKPGQVAQRDLQDPMDRSSVLINEPKS